LKSSFPPLPARLADPRLRRWGPPLVAALLCQLLVLQALRPSGPELRRARRAALADDTPTLLRWSRLAPRQAEAAALPTIPLQGLSALPPPPPSSLPTESEAKSPGPLRQGGRAPSQPDGLPAQPGVAFALVRQVALGEWPQEPPIPALVAVQRRQWWLLPAQTRALEALWTGGVEKPWPQNLGAVPKDVSVRQVPVTAAASLSLAELHGCSLRSGDDLWLLWQQGSRLWILRGPVALPTDAA
jgi:hypothetical protein